MRRAARSISRRGFTLLEAVIALLVLGSVIVSVLSLRSQALAQSERISARQSLERERESLFRMLLAGILDEPVRTHEGERTVWQGTHLGREYEIVREIERFENPMLGTGRVVSAEISAWKYTIMLGGRSSSFYWHA